MDPRSLHRGVDRIYGILRVQFDSQGPDLDDFAPINTRTNNYGSQHLLTYHCHSTAKSFVERLRCITMDSSQLTRRNPVFQFLGLKPYDRYVGIIIPTCSSL
jgi:hypothetical protein